MSVVDDHHLCTFYLACFNVCLSLDSRWMDEVDVDTRDTLAELSTANGNKTTVSFLKADNNEEALKRLLSRMKRGSRLFFVEGDEPPDDETWLTVAVVGRRLLDEVVLVWSDNLVHFKQILTDEELVTLSNGDLRLNSMVCHGNVDGNNNKFMVDIMTDLSNVESFDDLLSDDINTSVEFRCALDDYLPSKRADDDLKAFSQEVSKRETNSMRLWIRCGSSNHFFRELKPNKNRFALDVFAYRKDGTQTLFFTGPVEFSAFDQQLCKGRVVKDEFMGNEGELMPVRLSAVTGESLKDAKVGDRWNALMDGERKAAKPVYSTANDGNDSAEQKRLQEIRKNRQARQKRQKMLMTEPNGLVLFESFGSNERHSASEAVAQLSVNGLVSYRSMSDEVIASPRRYLTQHDVVYKLMTKAADIAGFCQEDDIRELFAYGLEAKQNLRWLYNHIGQIAKKSGPRQVLALNASVWRVIYAMNNNTIGAMLFCLFLAPAEVKGMMAESIGDNWQRRANLLKESLESRECVYYVNLFQKQIFDNLKLLTYTRPWLEIWPDLKPRFDFFICCLNICVDLFPYELH